MQYIVEYCLEILHQRCTLDIMNKLNRLTKGCVCTEFEENFLHQFYLKIHPHIPQISNAPTVSWRTL